MGSNPYIAGNPVFGENAFIGRKDVLQGVLRILQNPHEIGVVLYGQRRIGKTSVLLELASTLSQRGPYAPIYFDLQDKALLSLDKVLGELANRILLRLELPKLDEETQDIQKKFRKEFLPYVLSQLPEETALILLFDEFDVLEASDSQAGSAFFPYLRDLMSSNIQRMKFIFVSGRRPEELDTVFLSLFKSVTSRHISLLSLEDTAVLLRLSERNNSLKWSNEAVTQVQHLTGGHPFLTQQLCQIVWDNIITDNEIQESTPSIDIENTKPVNVPIVQSYDVNYALPDALDSATNSLEWLWNGLKPAQRVVASALAEAGSGKITQEKLEQCLQESGVRILIGELQDAPKVLEEWDLIRSENGMYYFPVEMLRRWIAKRKPLSRVQDEIDRILPVAESLFQAAYVMYQGEEFEDAAPLLRQAIDLNPNHLKATQALVEILLTQGDVAEARERLETLYKYKPSTARPRLIQVLLQQAKDENQDGRRLEFYEKVIELDREQPEAVAEYQKIWKKHGNANLQNNEIEEALKCYKRAYKFHQEAHAFKFPFIQKLLIQAKENKLEDERLIIYEQILELNPKQSEAIAEYQKILEKQGNINIKNNRIEEAYQCYKKAYKFYQEADAFKLPFIQSLLVQAEESVEEDEQIFLYERILQLDPNQPKAVAESRKYFEKQGDIAFENNELEEALHAYQKAEATEKIKRIEEKLHLGEVYQQAIDALQSGEKLKAQNLLMEVLSIDPSFQETTRYMHLVAHGVDIIKQENELRVSTESILKQKAFITKLESKQTEQQKIIKEQTYTIEELQSKYAEEQKELKEQKEVNKNLQLHRAKQQWLNKVLLLVIGGFFILSLFVSISFFTNRNLINKHEKTINSLQYQIAERQKAVDDHKQGIYEYENEIKSRENMLQDYQKKAEYYETTLQEYEKIIKGYVSIFKEQKETLELYSNTIISKNEKIFELANKEALPPLGDKIFTLLPSEIERSLKGNKGSIAVGGGLAFSPNGDLLASGGAKLELKIWQVDTGEILEFLLNKQCLYI